MKAEIKSWGCRCEECDGTLEERRGNCYEMCARYVLAHGGKLIHGRIHAPADIDRINHRDLDHAWVEYEAFGTTFVWEPVAGVAYWLDYWNARFKPERFASYDGAKAVCSELVKHRNWGSWYDSP